MRKEPVLYNHQPRKVGPSVLQRITALKVGQKMQDLPEELWHESFRFYVKEDPTRQGGPNLRLIRLDPDQPALTVTGYIYNKFVHPYEDRFITPREAARLQGFPDDLEFKGSLTSVQQQIGDAVPVELGNALFRTLLQTAKHLCPEQKVFPALSLFSGAGGLDVAAHTIFRDDESCWKTLACVELEKDRCETLRNYFGPARHVMQQDVRTLASNDILLHCSKSSSDIWLVYGGPPCQSFSQAGKQQGTCDPRGELIFEFLRIVREISPPLFLMENVSNLKGIAKGTLLQHILTTMDQMGYHVDQRVLNAAQYGTAQKRRRMIFFGTRKDLGTVAYLPEPTHNETSNLLGLPPFKTVGEAFAGLPCIVHHTHERIG
jgi:DNA (cytosine-5)-methyltransferase 1